MEIKIIKEKISKDELAKITKENYGNMVKVDVDVEKEILALGGRWHSEGQDILVKQEGSNGLNVWGINFYPFEDSNKRVEYISLINVKPSLGVKKMEIEDKAIKQKIKLIINNLLLADNEFILS